MIVDGFRSFYNQNGNKLPVEIGYIGLNEKRPDITKRNGKDLYVIQGAHGIRTIIPESCLACDGCQESHLMASTLLLSPFLEERGKVYEKMRDTVRDRLEFAKTIYDIQKRTLDLSILFNL